MVKIVEESMKTESVIVKTAILKYVVKDTQGNVGTLQPTNIVNSTNIVDIPIVKLKLKTDQILLRIMSLTRIITRT